MTIQSLSSFFCDVKDIAYSHFQAATQMSMNEKYKEELLAQIQANEEARKKKRQDHLEEGARLRAAQAVELERLALIKEKKIQELSQSGVPSKYLAELAGLKIRA